MDSSSQYSLTLGEIAQLTGSQLIGDPQVTVRGVADLASAGEEDITFISNARYIPLLDQTRACAIFAPQNTSKQGAWALLLCENPSQAFQIIVNHFHPPMKRPSGFEGIHPTAVIHPTAEVDQDVSIGPYTVIDEHVHIRAGSWIGSHVYIGPRVTIGQECLLHPHVVIREGCELGDYVIIQPGAIIGACGFGYITSAEGKHEKIPHVGCVNIGDHAEIGANTTIDRGRFSRTKIGKGTKVDNLVQVGHNVEVGDDNILVAQSGIAGSTRTGRCVMIGGQAGIAGHLKLEDGVAVAAKAGVSKSLKRGVYNGIPALPIREYNETQVYLRKLSEFIKQVQMQEKRITRLESIENPSTAGAK